MTNALTSTNIQNLSSLVSNIDFVYMNTDRLFSDGYTTSAIDGITYRQYAALDCILDVAVNDNSIVFLTSYTTLSSVINTLKTLSSTLVGYNGTDVFNQYFYNLNEIEKTYTLDIKESYNTKSNFLLTIPYKKSFHYNIIPLKSTQGVDYEYNFNDVVRNNPTRQYDSLYLDNHNNLLCQYRTSGFPVKITKDEYTTVNIPDKIKSANINTLGLHNFGANWGNVPCNSDVILFDKFGYNNVSDHGAVSKNYTGTPLCVWLSGNTTSNSSNVVWVERWYDPNTVTQGDAFVAHVSNSATSLSPIVDKISTNTVIGQSKLSYLRMGDKRNKTYLNSFGDNLQFCLSAWSNKITDSVNSIQGFSIPETSTEVFNEGVFDGSLHYHIPPNDDLIINDNLTVGAWVYQDQWNCGIDTQYFGNFSNDEGYGLFFNTGANADLLTFPSTSGFIYGFNNRGYRVFEKSINESMALTSSRIDYITTDLYGARWLYDGINKNIYKLDTDDLLEEVINLSPDAYISKLQINSQNELYVLDTHKNTISGFDINGSLKYGPYSSSGYNNFEITSTDSIKKAMADIMVLDGDDNVFTSLGINIYRNGTLFYHIGYKSLAMNVDKDNNVWVLYDTNKLLKLDPNGEVVFNAILDVPFESETSAELNFVKESRTKCEIDYVWIVFNTNNFVLKLDLSGKIIKYINIRDVVNLKSCKYFYLNAKGDFTGFNTKHKFNKLPSGENITSTNPAISVKINVKCGTTKKTIQLHTSAKDLVGWNHIAFSHSISNNKTYISLYLNGIVHDTVVINGIYFIEYGSKVSPYIIGGRSGKLGATNVEVGLNNEQFFQGKINDVRIYNKTLSTFELRGLATNLYYDGWSDMTWYVTTPERTYMEEILGYHLHSYKGSKSNKFNIKIKNMQITDPEVKNTITSAIRSSIKKFTPINTELNSVIFE